MNYFTRSTVLVCCAVAAHFASLALAQDYPTKPIRIIVAGGPDNAARIVGQKLTDAWGLQVVIDNRPGAGGQIGAELVAKGQPDGYLLLMFTTAHTINATLQPGSYDLLKDFTPVIVYSCTPEILVVHPSLPVHTVKELIALAKAKPGQINFASAGNGTPLHLGGEMFKHMAGINIVHVPYKGAAPALVDVVGGQVQMMFQIAPGVLPQVRAGKLRALAVTPLQRSRLAPELPTMDESGLPGFDITACNGLLAPAKTPRPIVEKLNAQISRDLKQPDVIRRITDAGYEPIESGNSPEQVGEFLRSEVAKWAKLIKETGAKAD
jgi:tripartite-type tricarboxylate transporter receptor subunit TctC